MKSIVIIGIIIAAIIIGGGSYYMSSVSSDVNMGEISEVNNEEIIEEVSEGKKFVLELSDSVSMDGT
ncbi:hypothetical protein [Nitrosopumilus sp. S6]